MTIGTQNTNENQQLFEMAHAPYPQRIQHQNRLILRCNIVVDMIVARGMDERTDGRTNVVKCQPAYSPTHHISQKRGRWWLYFDCISTCVCYLQ